LTTLLCRFG